MHSDDMLGAVNAAVAVAEAGNMDGLTIWCNNALGIVGLPLRQGELLISDFRFENLAGITSQCFLILAENLYYNRKAEAVAQVNALNQQIHLMSQQIAEALDITFSGPSDHIASVPEIR